MPLTISNVSVLSIDLGDEERAKVRAVEPALEALENVAGVVGVNLLREGEHLRFAAVKGRGGARKNNENNLKHNEKTGSQERR